MKGIEIQKKSEFEQRFPYDAEKYRGVIFFFDNMITRCFVKLLGKIANKQSGMICETIGYNLSADCDWVGDGAELWWGVRDDGCIISYEMFVKSIGLAADIWLKNNSASLDKQTVEEVKGNVEKIRRIYL